ncbi:ABC transporter ATP-binding protein [Pollutimonas bauzanensis]|uniref:ATP-binding cassette, subfamily B n=1 Tax=Pollutimonas bauzanensis TaxID=658167 RepID=A0A1M5MRW0_9BURK|nr:ABC transporter ATP-binding protein [Pollutimonas bauzanensis]SHG80114.1 ATP-binding cassette, subfamily B [Pollutimonas bauzanensis]
MKNSKPMQQERISTPIHFGNLLRLASRPLGWAVATAIGSAALSIAPFWFIYRIAVELFSAQPDMAVVWQLAWWALGLLALRWALMAVSHVLAHTGAFAIQHRLRLAMARRLGEVPLSFFAGRGSGSMRRTLTDDVNGLEGFYAHLLPDMVAAAVVPLAALALLFAADWRLALAALVPLPLALLAQWWWMRGIGGRMREWNDLQKRIANQVGEYVRGVHVVKSFGLDARSFGELATAVRGAVAWVEGYAKDSSGGWVLFTGLLTANLITVAPLGAWLHAQGTLDLPTYVLFLLVAPTALAPLLRLTFALDEQFQRAEAMGRINEVLQAQPSADPVGSRIPDGALDVDFIDLRHRYGERLALDGVSFRAKAGRLTALVGPSGSGKSTLVRLVARLYEFESGSLQVGGMDVREWPLDALLGRLGIVFQDVFLFHGTVRENLAMARPGASDAQIETAARAARAHDFIMALPQGYDTSLGDRGAGLSGGERQRLAIARALLKNAPILLLDEATASVDAENEALIQQALDELCRGRTVLMIGHRLHSVMHADHIVVMNGGVIAGQGTHVELLNSCLIYQCLWRDHEQSRDWSLGESRHATPTRESRP